MFADGTLAPLSALWRLGRRRLWFQIQRARRRYERSSQVRQVSYPIEGIRIKHSHLCETMLASSWTSYGELRAQATFGMLNDA